MSEEALKSEQKGLSLTARALAVELAKEGHKAKAIRERIVRDFGPEAALSICSMHRIIKMVRRGEDPGDRRVPGATNRSARVVEKIEAVRRIVAGAGAKGVTVIDVMEALNVSVSTASRLLVKELGCDKREDEGCQNRMRYTLPVKEEVESDSNSDL